MRIKAKHENNKVVNLFEGMFGCCYLKNTDLSVCVLTSMHKGTQINLMYLCYQCLLLVLTKIQNMQHLKSLYKGLSFCVDSGDPC